MVDGMTTDDRILHRIRALLAKAESTPYAEEATALTAKAQELIAAHAIDLALVAEQTGRGEITTRVVFIPAPYPKEKFLLLGGVASANGCRAILGLDDLGRKSMLQAPELFRDDGRYATIVGYASDLDATELVFTSLLVQAVNVMLAHGRQVDDYACARHGSGNPGLSVGEPRAQNLAADPCGWYQIVHGLADPSDPEQLGPSA